MTMPSDAEIRDMFPKHPDHGKTIRMVPADIADELARAASVTLAYYYEESREYIDGMTDLLAALTAYRDITP